MVIMSIFGFKQKRLMSEFKEYKRKSISEMREVTNRDIEAFKVEDEITVYWDPENRVSVSISDEDRDNGSPKLGDMIARNPKNHKDQWLVAKAYFEDNLEPI